MAPNSDDNPRMWRNRMATETAEEDEKSTPVSGKYRVQPAATPSWTEMAQISSCMARTESQNARLFSLGVAKSSAAVPTGTVKLPRPEIMPGMMKRKTMPRPCEVTAR